MSAPRPDQNNSGKVFMEGFLANLRKPLNFPSELGILVEGCFRHQKAEALHEFTFTVKNFRGLARSLQLASENRDVTNYDALIADINAASQRIGGQLEELLHCLEISELEAFREKIFPEAPEEKAQALQKFFADVEQLKNHFNDLRRAFEDGEIEGK